jgi:hypothetical protein
MRLARANLESVVLVWSLISRTKVLGDVGCRLVVTRVGVLV